MEPKKISFGFNKVTKKSNLLPVKSSKPEQQVELIKCLEEQKIKLVEEQKEAAPMVIPLKENGKTSAALASLMKRRAVLLGEEEELSTTEASQAKSDLNNVDDTSKDDIDKRAVREILADLKKSNETVRDSGLVLPILKPDELPLDGAKESNLDDYESIPIEQYGLAMLRGMGWKEPPLSMQNKLSDDGPMVRPKGMGLGADKALKRKPLLVQPEANETLEIKKQAYVRILGGKFKDAYGQIEGFDDEAGRVIVKMAIGGAKEAFNEFLCQPVSKKEFSQYGKCINVAKYEEYKKQENEHGQIVVKKEVNTKPKVEHKLEKEDKKIVNAKIELTTTSISSSDNCDSYGRTISSRQRYDEYNASSSYRGRSRSRLRSSSSSRSRYSSRKYDDRYSDDSSDSYTEESDTDSAYERRKKQHTKSKSKSHRRKSKSSKKKRRHSSSSGSSHYYKTSKDSSFSDESDDERYYRRQGHSTKKNKKKTKKSKKHRSRTPNRHKK